MASEDADKIYSSLQYLDNNNKFILEEVSHHRTIVNEVIEAFQKTSKYINHNFVIVNFKLHMVNNNTSELQKKICLLRYFLISE